MSFRENIVTVQSVKRRGGQDEKWLHVKTLMSPEMKTPSRALKTAAEETPVTPVRLQPEM